MGGTSVNPGHVGQIYSAIATTSQSFFSPGDVSVRKYDCLEINI
jgi:hypothetical protein